MLATKRTIISEQYQLAAESYQNVTVHSQIGYDLVSLIEAGNINTPEMDALLRQYLNHVGARHRPIGAGLYPLSLFKENLQAPIAPLQYIIDSGVALQGKPSVF